MTDIPASGSVSPYESGLPAILIEECLGEAADLLSDERADQLTGIRRRWASRTFSALVVGEFKRGKSTLLNALIGEELLPTGVQPVTAVPTRVRSGPRSRAVVLFQDGSESEISPRQACEYIDESRNPGNKHRVASVDLEVEAGPAPGVVLVDVPGFGSIHKHNTESALAALPEADAALVVASVDPPIGEAEIRLLRAVRDHAARIDVVLNKVDYLDETGRKAAQEFTHRALAAEGFPEPAVWPVSARDGLRARLSRDEDGWRRSGMEALSSYLERFFEEERAVLLARSLAKKTVRLLDQESALLEMRRAAAERSSENLRQIIKTFRSRRGAAGRDAADAARAFWRRFESLFASYAERAARAWKGPRDAFQARARGIRTSRDGASRLAASKEINAAARETVEIFVDDFFAGEVPRFAGAYERLCLEVAEAAAERAEAVWRLAADLLPFDPPGVDAPAAPPAPRPSGFLLDSQRLVLEDLKDAASWLLPRKTALRRQAAAALREVDARYGRAVEQFRDSLNHAYERHFRGLLLEFEACAERTAKAIDAALWAAEARAEALEAGREDAFAADASRLTALEALRKRLAGIANASAEQSP